MSEQRAKASGQTTADGARVVTVGRYGCRMACAPGRYNVPLWTSKVYRAERRRRDGVLTWRLVREFRHHVTAGRGITAPMVGRAESEAEILGVPHVAGVTHGTVCE